MLRGCPNSFPSLGQNWPWQGAVNLQPMGLVRGSRLLIFGSYPATGNASCSSFRPPPSSSSNVTLRMLEVMTQPHLFLELPGGVESSLCSLPENLLALLREQHYQSTLVDGLVFGSMRTSHGKHKKNNLLRVHSEWYSHLP